MRLTLRDIRLSRIPELIGVCITDVARIAAYVNDAQQRIIFAGKDAGWWQGWVKVAFTVSQANPYITLPREFARIINMAIEKLPIYVQNEFYEVLPGGVGPAPSATDIDWCGTVTGYERGTSPTFVDLDDSNQLLRLYSTDIRDNGTYVIISNCLDQNGNQIYSDYGPTTVNGLPMQLASPLVDSAFVVTKIGGIIKPVTFGDVLLYQVDQTSGAEVLLSRYKASETNPAYRRYYLSPMPDCFCNQTSFTITALCKQEYIPAIRDTDPLIVGNLPAMTEMIQALRYYSQDVAVAHQLGAMHEKRALKLMRQEMDHYLGTEVPAVAVDALQGASFMRLGLSTNI